MTSRDAPDGLATHGRRLLIAVRSKPSRGQLVVAALCGLLAFGLVTQVHATAKGGGLQAARVDDLLGILSDLDNRGDRLRAEIGDLQAREQRLRSGSGQSAAAVREARDRLRVLGVLTGTVAARGPGVVLVVDDPRGRVRADTLVDAIEELRDAGAEAMQLSGVRVVADTAIVDAGGSGAVVDGHRVGPPTRLAAPGARAPAGVRRALAGARGVPGGVLDAVGGQSGAHATVVPSPVVPVGALRPLEQ